MDWQTIINNNPKFSTLYGPTLLEIPNQFGTTFLKIERQFYHDLLEILLHQLLNQQTTQKPNNTNALTDYEDYSPNDFMN